MLNAPSAFDTVQSMDTLVRSIGRWLPLALLVAQGAGCATTMIPIHPSSRDMPPAEPVQGVRFDPDHIAFREPAQVVSTGNIWKREVARFAAERLNAHVAAAPGSPAAQTVVTFELSGPSMIQIGAYKEMTVTLRSTLPDGRVVKSAPLSGYLDSNLEFAAEQCLLYGGPVLDIAAFVVAIYLLSTNQLFTPWACGGIVLLAATGLSLNLAQGGLSMFVTYNEERRWSDLFAQALAQHADDVRAEVSKAPVRRLRPPAPASAHDASTGAEPRQVPPPTTLPPPLLDDPADAPDAHPPDAHPGADDEDAPGPPDARPDALVSPDSDASTPHVPLVPSGAAPDADGDLPDAAPQATPDPPADARDEGAFWF